MRGNFYHHTVSKQCKPFHEKKNCLAHRLRNSCANSYAKYTLNRHMYKIMLHTQYIYMCLRGKLLTGCCC